MGTVVEIYQLVRDLIDEAKKQRNIELVEKLIDIKIAISDLQEKNSELEKKLEQQENVERHDDGQYITLKDDPLKIRYCSTCWGNNQKLIQLPREKKDSEEYPECPICFNNWLAARNSGK